MAKGKRRLDNWLDSFVEWVMPRSEAPKSMIEWAGLFTLSALMRRKVKWPRSLLGGYEVYPNLYVIFVAKPAVVRKSTTVGFAEKLLRRNELERRNKIKFAGNVTSHSKMLDAIAEAPDNAVAVVASEFSSLIQTTPEDMYEILIDLYDNKENFYWDTWAHGGKPIDTPVINLFAATTPAWISDQPPSYFVGGGFASRVIFVYEERPRQRELYYDHLDEKKRKVLETDLAHDLNLIGKVKGEFRHADEETKEHCRQWYLGQPILSEDPRLEGFHGRKHTHAHKVSMLLSLAERGDRVVTKAHWDRATALLDYIEKQLPKAFSDLGVDPKAQVMEKMLQYIEAKGGAKQSEIAGRFYTEGLTLEQLKAMLGYLCFSGRLEWKEKVKGGKPDPLYLPTSEGS